MQLLTKEIITSLPRLYTTENENDPIVHIKFFDPTGRWTWYATEGEERGDDFLFFGWVAGDCPELGYFTLNQLKTAKQGIKGLRAVPIERDTCFKPCRLSEVMK